MHCTHRANQWLMNKYFVNLSWLIVSMLNTKVSIDDLHISNQFSSLKNIVYLKCHTKMSLVKMLDVDESAYLARIGLFFFFFFLFNILASYQFWMTNKFGLFIYCFWSISQAISLFPCQFVTWEILNHFIIIIIGYTSTLKLSSSRVEMANWVQIPG